jgi:hypothetical protein
MRIGQLQSLTSKELEYLLYIVNVVEPLQPPLEITPKFLLFFKHDKLVKKVADQEAKLTDDGKKIHQSLMTKLNKHWIQEVIDHENSTKPEFTQPEFSFG